MVSADARLRRESVIVGDDGKWNKCEAQLSDMDVNGEIKCEAEVCSVLCMPGFMVEGPVKAKCVKGKDGEWSFNKDLGVCVEGEDDMEDDMEDKPDKPDMEDHEDDEMDHEDKPDHEDYEEKPEDYEDKPDKPEEDDGDMYDDEEKPDGEKPDMEDMPDVFGDDGKWNKCEIEAIDMGKIKCEADKCMLYCMEGFMVEGTDYRTVIRKLTFVKRPIRSFFFILCLLHFCYTRFVTVFISFYTIVNSTMVRPAAPLRVRY